MFSPPNYRALSIHAADAHDLDPSKGFKPRRRRTEDAGQLALMLDIPEGEGLMTPMAPGPTADRQNSVSYPG